MSVLVSGAARGCGVPVVTTGTLSGQVTNSVGGAAVPGGTVQLLQSGSVITTATPDGSGNYSFPNLTTGSYTVTNQPPRPANNASYGIADAGSFAVSVSSGSTTTQNFSVQISKYDTDFQNFTTTAQLTDTASPITSGALWYHSSTTYQTLAVVANRTGDAITLNATGGPTSNKAMQYHVATWNGGVHGAPNTVSIQKRINPALTVSSFYALWTDMYSGTFQNGGSGATGSDREYKVFLLDIGSGAGGLGHIGVYIEGNDPSYRITMDSTDRLTGNVNTTHATSFSLGALASWTGKWNTWLLGMENCGSSNYRLFLMLNGTLIMDFTGQSFFPLQGGSVAGATQVQIGEQLNNGPDQDWDRYWAELGIYADGRPTQLALVP